MYFFAVTPSSVPLLYLVAQHIASRNMAQTILLNHFFTLSALAGTGGTEDDNVLHRYIFVLIDFTKSISPPPRYIYPAGFCRAGHSRDRSPQ